MTVVCGGFEVVALLVGDLESLKRKSSWKEKGFDWVWKRLKNKGFVGFKL